MLITELTLKGHPVLQDFHIDFKDDIGSPFSTVILAGANGCGKTVVLDAIQRIFEWSFPNFSIDVKLRLDDTNITDFQQLTGASLLDDKELMISYTYKEQNSWSSYRFSWKTKGEPKTYQITNHAEAVNTTKRSFRSFFSQTQINFSVGGISAITSTGIDDPGVISTRSADGLAHQIGQLLVDIRAADNEDLSEWVKAHRGIAVPEDVQQQREKRFTRAFEIMFPAKRLKRTGRENNQHQIYFEEYGRESTLNQLSTGEKQIVFRAGFFLQNLTQVLSRIVLIDEPELSLQPEWQGRIVEFYQTLLDAKDRETQIFIATHSPFVVHGSPSAKIIILEKGNTGKIQVAPHPSYPSAGAALAVRAFNLDSFLSAAKHPLLVLVEGESDVAIISEAWCKLYPGQPRFFELRAALNDRNISITLNDQLLFSKLGERKIVGIFDFDVSFNQWKGVWKSNHDVITTDESKGVLRKAKAGPGWAMLLPVPPHRRDYASLALGGDSILSIEFVFSDADIPQNWISHLSKPLGKTEPRFLDKHKMEFSAYVRDLRAASFAHFAPLFDQLKQIIE